MTDQFSLCLGEYITQLKTLATSTAFFPAAIGRSAGWQISEDDTIVKDGGDYFIIYRLGQFQQTRSGQFQENVWHINTWLFMRFSEYTGLWSGYRQFRSAVLELPDTQPLKRYGIYSQSFNAGQDAGYQRDENGNYTNFVVQQMDCTINQRVLITRAL